MTAEPVWHGVDEPDPNARIWRYMEFAKFAYLIQERCLVFVSPSEFKDPFEGSYTSSDVEQLRRAIIANPDKADVVLHNAGVFSWASNKLIPEIFVSCWYLGDHESDAMWGLHGGGNCVAVQSTYGRLAALRKPGLLIGRVRYADETSPTGFENILNPLFRKRPAFAHETELRAAYWTILPKAELKAEADGAVHFPVDPQFLIERVYVPYFAKPWFERAVKGCIASAGLSLDVVRSSLGGQRIDPLKELLVRLGVREHARVDCPDCHGSGLHVVRQEVPTANGAPYVYETMEFCKACRVVEQSLPTR
jgi:hypothetical protein